MNHEFIAKLRYRWRSLRIYRRPGSIVVDYRLLKNYARIYKPEEAAK